VAVALNLKLRDIKTSLVILGGITVIILVILSVIFLAIASYEFNKNKKPTQTPLPTVNPLRAKFQENTTNFLNQTKLARDKPYQGTNFVIEYSPSAKAYFVSPQTKTLEDYHQVKKEAEKFFKDSGISDLCSIRIFFTIPSEIKNQITKEDLTATGCPTP
jgi:hypothetical protein